jgi:F-type H+-transporting ATPase subunit epsilon
MMQSQHMRLNILLPFKVFTAKEDVTSITAKTAQGFMGLLPHRLDCVVALTPGILTWKSEAEEQVTVAVDQGLLVKAGLDVWITVRNAIAGTDLATLHQSITQEFLHRDAEEKAMHIALSKLESGFIRRFAELQHG